MRAAKFSALPPELIHAIAGHVELRDLLVLCRASRHIHAISLRYIYRVLAFENLPQVVRCCKTIISRPEAGMSVRELKIVCHPRYAMKSFYTIFGCAMTRMQNLRVMDVCFAELFSTFSDTIFPQLLDCTLTVSFDSFSFLRKNPTINSMAIIPVGEPSSDFRTSQSIHMPNIHHFEGPEIAVCSVLPGAPVSSLVVFWTQKPTMAYSRGLTAAASSTADIVDLSNLVYTWDPALLVAISKHTLRVKFLGFRHATKLPSSFYQKEVFLSAMDDTLRSLPCLMGLLVLEGTPSLPIHWIDETLESEFDRVRRWGDICPTLTSISLSSMKTTWVRVRDNLWFPGNCTDNRPETVECLKWFIKKAIVSPDLPAGYRMLAEYFAGSSAIVELEEAVKRDEAIPAFDIVYREDGSTVISFPSDH